MQQAECAEDMGMFMLEVLDAVRTFDVVGYWENQEIFAVDEYVFNTGDQVVNDWRIEIADYLRNPS